MVNMKIPNQRIEVTQNQPLRVSFSAPHARGWATKITLKKEF